jgi:GNAT superfamily N-acetyltransferase
MTREDDNPDLVIRRATIDDAPVLADQRVAMFREMGRVLPDSESALHQQSVAYLTSAIPSGEYVAWVMHSSVAPGKVVAGAGVQLRPLMPRPDVGGGRILVGGEGLVLNVYVDRAWRRRGLARRLMLELIAWAPSAGVVRLVLHPSEEGHPLYTALGFVQTNEMRYSHPL